mgnify:CR=1 FL=1
MNFLLPNLKHAMPLISMTKKKAGSVLLLMAGLPLLLAALHLAKPLGMQVNAGEDVSICTGDTTQLAANGADSYLWSPAVGLSCTACPSPLAFPSTTTMYYLTGNDGTVDSVLVSVFLPPQIVSVDFNNPTDCSLPNGSIIVLANGQADLEYSINGGATWYDSGIFTALPAGSYTIAVRNEGGTCTVQGPSGQLTAPPTPQITNVIGNNPTFCDLPNGSIIVTASGGIPPLQYSIDGGANWQSQNLFQLLGSGIYQIAVRSHDNSCIVSGGTVTLTGSPEEANITGILSFPPILCNGMDGAITIQLSNDDGSFEYSINGGVSYQPSNSFTGLGEGHYSIVVRKTNGTCKTNGGFVTLKSNNRPEIYGTSFVDPQGCDASNGIITVLAFGFSTLSFSIDGGATWQPSNSFPNLPGGDYKIAVQNDDGTCFTEGDLITLTGETSPEISSIQFETPTTCWANNGAILVTATAPGNLEYSIDGGATFQSNGQFTGLQSGAYQIAVRETGGHCQAISQVTLAGPGCPDTVQATIPAGITTVFCLDPSVHDIPGTLTGAGFCGQGSTSTVFATDINQLCITLSPAAGFAGASPDLICAVHCFNNSASQCDTTYISVFVAGQINCDDVFPNDTVNGNFFGNPTSFCVLTPLVQLQGYDLVFNGQPLTNPWDCKFEPVTAYSYAILPGNGASGPYNLTAWTVGGNTFTGFFTNVNALLDLMNFFDPSGDWNINPQGAILYGGNPATQYGNMAITHVPSNLNTVLTPNQLFVPAGFTVGLSFPGVNVLIATDPITGCADTLYIDATPPPTITETVLLTTTVNTPTPPYCLDGDELPGGVIASVGYCGGPNNGGAPLVNDTCVFYVPGLNFAGQDTFCMVVCDGGFPEQICDTTLFIVNVLPEVDTVYLTIPAGETTLDTCLSSFVIELPGPVTSTGFCGIDVNAVNVAVNENCINFEAVNNFSGTTTICVVHCSGTVCDTNVIILTVVPPIICQDIFTQSTIVQTVVNEPGFLCISIPLTEILGYAVTVNGNLVTPAYIPCNVGNVVVYPYSGLPSGPYFLESWTANGNTFFGNVPSIAALVDSMKVWDPAGNWNNNLATQSIQGGTGGGTYSDIVISQVGGGVFTLELNLVQMALGSQMPVSGFGTHEIIVTALNGCADTVTFVLEQHFISTDTIYVSTEVNTSLLDLCGNTDELLGNLVSVDFCGLPANGGFVQTNATCFTYLPNLDFTGTDGFCIVLCDDSDVPVCDTFVFVITVTGIGPNTLDIVTVENVPSQITCLDIGGLPGNFTGLSVCQAPANGMIISSANCFTYNPNTGFIGTDQACVVVCDDQGNCDTTLLNITVNPLCSLFDFFPPDEQVFEVDNCSDIVSYCVPVPLDSIGNFGVLDNGFPYTGGFSPCNGIFTQINFDTGYHEIVFFHLNTGCHDTLFANVTCDTGSNGCGIQPLSSLSLVADCDAAAQFCLNIPMSDLQNYLIENNGAVFTGTVGACDNNSQFVGVMLDTGQHVLVFNDTVKGCSSLFSVLVACQIFEDVTVEVTVPVGESLTLCLADFGFIPSLIDSIVNMCPGNGNASFTANNQALCITVFGETIGLDTACLQVYFTDTSVFFNVYVTVVEPCPDWIPGDFIANGVDCSLDSGWLCLPVNPAVLSGKVLNLDGVLYTGTLLPCDFDSIFSLNYSSLPSQGLLGPYIVQSWTVNGSSFTGVFETAQELADSMNVWDPSGNWQVIVNPLDQTIAITGGNATNVYGVMIVVQAITQIQVDLGINSAFVPQGTAIYIPIGSYLLTLSDPATLCTDQLTVGLACVTPDIVTDTLQVGESGTYCLDFSELPGPVASITNICEGTLGEVVEFEIINDCVTYTALEPGTDEACFVVCDSAGVCDTTYFFITVEFGSIPPPIAVNDTVITGQDQVVAINVLQNDTVVSLLQFFILDPPIHGTATFLPNGTVNYVPASGYCDESVPDSFTYVICNPADCDTATVFVTVRCSGLVIYNAFSPNEDGTNDRFKITGLQDWPDHKLYVYNRWGNLIFEATNYQSDWDGTWNGKKLPDGTYFYVLDLGDGKKPKTGHLQIMR